MIVEKRAIMELIGYIEKKIDEVILQSEKELDKLNQIKRVQGVYRKNRIDQDCIRNAIKTISSKEYSHLPK